MVFLINDLILAGEEGLQLKADSTTEIKLTQQSWRLLSLLILNQGEIISRESLFKMIWEDFGLTSSNTSLTQYISVLRRAFKAIGITDEVIITVPKVGFKLSADIIITRIDNPPFKEHAPPLVTPKNWLPYVDNSACLKTIIVKIPRPVMWGALCIIVLGLLLITFRIVNEAKMAPLFQIDTIKKCKIYSFKQLNEQEKQSYLKNINGFVKQKRLECTDSTAIVMYINDEKKISDRKLSCTQKLYSICNLNGNSAQICSNYVLSSDGVDHEYE